MSTFVAMWPIEDMTMGTKSLLGQATVDIRRLAEIAGVTLTGDPTVEFTEHATRGLCIVGSAPAMAV